MNFHVGQKVVCVDDGNMSARLEKNRVRETLPKKGQTYTIRSILPPARTRRSDFSPGLLLEEIVNPVLKYAGGQREVSFCISRFRPLVTRKTDISIFKRMLIPVPEKVRV